MRGSAASAPSPRAAPSPSLTTSSNHRTTAGASTASPIAVQWPASPAAHREWTATSATHSRARAIASARSAAIMAHARRPAASDWHVHCTSVRVATERLAARTWRTSSQLCHPLASFKFSQSSAADRSSSAFASAAAAHVRKPAVTCLLFQTSSAPPTTESVAARSVSIDCHVRQLAATA
eukprot:scaffold34601_cov45-Phaeocystis_antarctica.AAC.1